MKVKKNYKSNLIKLKLIHSRDYYGRTNLNTTRHSLGNRGKTSIHDMTIKSCKIKNFLKITRECFLRKNLMLFVGFPSNSKQFQMLISTLPVLQQSDLLRNIGPTFDLIVSYNNQSQYLPRKTCSKNIPITSFLDNNGDINTPQNVFLEKFCCALLRKVF